jgi:hypothetical protein
MEFPPLLTITFLMSKKAPSPRRTHIKEAHTVLQEALLHVGDSPAVAGGKNAQVAAHKRVAAAVGVSASMLYKWREPAELGSGHTNPLERVVKLITATGDDRIVDWLAQQAGGHFVKDEAATASPLLARDANALVKQFSVIITEVISAAEDNRISPDESQALRTKWNALQKRTEAFVRACEKGAYGTTA